jgi:hypothetical protein
VAPTTSATISGIDDIGFANSPFSVIAMSSNYPFLRGITPELTRRREFIQASPDQL